MPQNVCSIMIYHLPSRPPSWHSITFSWLQEGSWCIHSWFPLHWYIHCSSYIWPWWFIQLNMTTSRTSNQLQTHNLSKKISPSLLSFYPLPMHTHIPCLAHALFHHLQWRYHRTPWPSTLLHSSDLLNHLVRRINEASVSIWPLYIQSCIANDLIGQLFVNFNFSHSNYRVLTRCLGS